MRKTDKKYQEFKIKSQHSQAGLCQGEKIVPLHPLAGKTAEPSMLVDIAELVAAYQANSPDPADPAQRIAFGTSGHRGSAFDGSFNEAHILAISQAVCDYRRAHDINGPLFLGMDTHALSPVAFATTLEVLAGNGVEVMIDSASGYTPTPVISHAIITHNRARPGSPADGIVITPSHNPPDQGGFKYNPPHGGPAGSDVTTWIEKRANQLLADRGQGVRWISLARAQSAETTHRHNYITAYVDDLVQVIDMDTIRTARLSIGVDPLGGAGVHYWGYIAERYQLPLTVVDDTVDPAFGFMSLDWDGKIRMDCSSPWAMQRLIGMKDRFNIAWACDTDHDRHGIVTRSSGLLNPNHYLAVCAFYLFKHRPHWSCDAGIGKTVVSSSIIDRVAAQSGLHLTEVPVGFKWFVSGLTYGTLAFCGEESAGATLLRRDGTPWTTDKDGIVMGLLAAEITAVAGSDPGELYRELTAELGDPVYRRVDAPATPTQKKALAKLTPAAVQATELAGEKIIDKLTVAPGNDAPIGGLKVTTQNGWFAARPSGTENLYKLYAESFKGEAHLQRILEEAQTLVDRVLASTGQ